MLCSNTVTVFDFHGQQRLKIFLKGLFAWRWANKAISQRVTNVHNRAVLYRRTLARSLTLPTFQVAKKLRSSCNDCLVQPPVHRSTVGSRAFSVAGPQVWNCLPPEFTSAPYLVTFRTRLKTFLFTESCPGIQLRWEGDIFVSTHCLWWT